MFPARWGMGRRGTREEGEKGLNLHVRVSLDAVQKVNQVWSQPDAEGGVQVLKPQEASICGLSKN